MWKSQESLFFLEPRTGHFLKREKRKEKEYLRIEKEFFVGSWTNQVTQLLHRTNSAFVVKHLCDSFSHSLFSGRCSWIHCSVLLLRATTGAPWPPQADHWQPHSYHRSFQLLLRVVFNTTITEVTMPAMRESDREGESMRCCTTATEQSMRCCTTATSPHALFRINSLR